MKPDDFSKKLKQPDPAKETQENGPGTLEYFLNAFKGATVYIFPGKKLVTLSLETLDLATIRKNIGEYYNQAYRIKFNLGKENPIVDPKHNYVDIAIDISAGQKDILLANATMEDERLKGHDVYPQVVELIGKNFPAGFELTYSAQHGKTVATLRKAGGQFDAGKITMSEYKDLIKQSHLIKLGINAGFNNFVIDIDNNSIAWVSARIIPNQEDVIIELQ